MSFKSAQFKNRFLCGFVAIAFFLNTVTSYAQVAPGASFLPQPGAALTLSSGFVPPHITGLTLHTDNPLQFDFIIDTGDARLKGEALKEESMKLVKYFMASLTVPDEDMWVNLSPYEKDRIIAKGLSQTDMGRDMLAQDYILKQLTASLISPENELGKKFWEKVRSQAKKKFGTIQVPTDTFNKIWIVPERASVYVEGKSVYVVDGHLRVLMEEDYLSRQSTVHSPQKQAGGQRTVDGGLTSQLLREIILPAIEHEVNTGKNFAQLRQIFYSMILATWYKQNLKRSLLAQTYADQNKVNGIDLADKNISEEIYDRYIEAFKKGVYNLIKEDYDPSTQEITSKQYFTGGEDFAQLAAKMNVPDPAQLRSYLNFHRNRDHAVLTAGINPVKPLDLAMIDRMDLVPSSVDILQEGDWIFFTHGENYFGKVAIQDGQKVFIAQNFRDERSKYSLPLVITDKNLKDFRLKPDDVLVDPDIQANHPEIYEAFENSAFPILKKIDAQIITLKNRGVPRSEAAPTTFSQFGRILGQWAGSGYLTLKDIQELSDGKFVEQIKQWKTWEEFGATLRDDNEEDMQLMAALEEMRQQTFQNLEPYNFAVTDNNSKITAGDLLMLQNGYFHDTSLHRQRFLEASRRANKYLLRTNPAMLATVEAEKQAIQTTFAKTIPFEDLTGIGDIELVRVLQPAQGQLGELTEHKELLHSTGMVGTRSSVYLRTSDLSDSMSEAVGSGRVLEVKRRYDRRLNNIYAETILGESSSETQPGNYRGEILGTGKSTDHQHTLRLDVVSLLVELIPGFGQKDLEGTSSFMLYAEKGGIRAIPWSRIFWRKFIVSPKILNNPNFNSEAFGQIEDNTERLKKVSEYTGRPVDDLRISLRYRKETEATIKDLLKAGVDMGPRGKMVEVNNESSWELFFQYIRQQIAQKGTAQIGKVTFHQGGNTVDVGRFINDDLDIIMGITSANKISMTAGLCKVIGAGLFSRMIIPQKITQGLINHLAEFRVKAQSRPKDTPPDGKTFYLDDNWTADNFIPTNNFLISVSAIKNMPSFGVPGARFSDEANTVHTIEMDGMSKRIVEWKIPYQNRVKKLKERIQRAKTPRSRIDNIYLLAGIYGRYGAFEESIKYFNEAIGQESLMSTTESDARVKLFSAVRDIFQGLRDLSEESPRKVRKIVINRLRHAFNNIDERLERKISRRLGKGAETRWKYGAGKILAAIYENDGDKEILDYQAGRGSHQTAAAFYREALVFDPENIELLSKFHHAQLLPAIKEYDDWMEQQLQTGRRPSDAEGWNKLIQIYKDQKLYGIQRGGAVFTNLSFWTVLKDKRPSERHDYFVAFRMVQRLVETLNAEELIEHKTRRSVAYNIVKYRGEDPEGVFLDLGRLFLDEVKAEGAFLAYLAEAATEANIIKYRGADQSIQSSTRTPDEALDEQIEYLKETARTHLEEHSTQGIFYELGEAYYRKALLLSNYGLSEKIVERYFLRSIEAFRAISRYEGLAPERAQYRIVEVLLAAGLKEKLAVGHQVKTIYGQAEIKDIQQLENEEIRLDVWLEKGAVLLKNMTPTELGIVTDPVLQEFNRARSGELRDLHLNLLAQMTRKIENAQGVGASREAASDVKPQLVGIMSLGIAPWLITKLGIKIGEDTFSIELSNPEDENELILYKFKNYNWYSYGIRKNGVFQGQVVLVFDNEGRLQKWESPGEHFGLELPGDGLIIQEIADFMDAQIGKPFTFEGPRLFENRQEVLDKVYEGWQKAQGDEAMLNKARPTSYGEIYRALNEIIFSYDTQNKNAYRLREAIYTANVDKNLQELSDLLSMARRFLAGEVTQDELDTRLLEETENESVDQSSEIGTSEDSGFAQVALSAKADEAMLGSGIPIVDLLRGRDVPITFESPVGMGNTGAHFDRLDVIGDPILSIQQPRILLIGGTLEEVRFLIGRYPQASIDIMNIGKEHLEEISRFGKLISKNIRLFLGDASRDLDNRTFADESYDLIFAASIDESTYGEIDMDERRQMLKRMASEEGRLVRLGGIIYHPRFDANLANQFPDVMQAYGLTAVTTSGSGKNIFLKKDTAMLRPADRPFGNTGLTFFPMGLGTLFYGHEWPVGNKDWVDPTQDEVDRHMLLSFAKMSNKDGILMVDTAAAYGTGEEKIGKFFAKHPEYLKRAFIATKWGLGSDFKETDYSLENLRTSFKRSVGHMGKVDLLYVHFETTPTSESLAPLRDKAVMDEMFKMRDEHEGGLKYLGITFTTPEQLEFALKEGLVDRFDVVQLYAKTFLERPDLIDQLKAKQKAIVLNSLYRKTDDETKADKEKTRQLYLDLFKEKNFSVYLTGTKAHIEENVGYLVEAETLRRSKSSIKIGSVEIKNILGDIVRVTSDAVIVPVNQEMAVGLGVTGAVIKAIAPHYDGDRSAAQLRAFPPPQFNLRIDEYEIGEAVLSSLEGIYTPSQWKAVISAVIHSNGMPVKPSDVLEAVKNALAAADKQGFSSVTLPAFGTGIGRMSYEESADAIMSGIEAYLKEHPESSLKSIQIVLNDDLALDEFNTRLNSSADAAMKADADLGTLNESNVFTLPLDLPKTLAEIQTEPNATKTDRATLSRAPPAIRKIFQHLSKYIISYQGGDQSLKEPSLLLLQDLLENYAQASSQELENKYDKLLHTLADYFGPHHSSQQTDPEHMATLAVDALKRAVLVRDFLGETEGPTNPIFFEELVESKIPGGAYRVFAFKGDPNENPTMVGFPLVAAILQTNPHLQTLNASYYEDLIQIATIRTLFDYLLGIKTGKGLDVRLLKVREGTTPEQFKQRLLRVVWAIAGHEGVLDSSDSAMLNEVHNPESSWLTPEGKAIHKMLWEKTWSEIITEGKWVQIDNLGAQLNILYNRAPGQKIYSPSGLMYGPEKLKLALDLNLGSKVPLPVFLRSQEDPSVYIMFEKGEEKFFGPGFIHETHKKLVDKPWERISEESKAIFFPVDNLINLENPNLTSDNTMSVLRRPIFYFDEGLTLISVDRAVEIINEGARLGLVIQPEGGSFYILKKKEQPELADAEDLRTFTAMDVLNSSYAGELVAHYEDRRVPIKTAPRLFEDVDTDAYLKDARSTEAIVLPGLSGLQLAMLRQHEPNGSAHDYIYFVADKRNVSIDPETRQVTINSAIYLNKDGAIKTLRFSRPLPLTQVIYDGGDSRFARLLRRLGYPQLSHNYLSKSKLASKEVFEKAGVLVTPWISMMDYRVKSEIRRRLEIFIRKHPGIKDLVVKPKNGSQGRSIMMFGVDQLEEIVDYIQPILSQEVDGVVVEERVPSYMYKDEEGRRRDWNMRVLAGWSNGELFLTPDTIEVRYNRYNHEPVNVSRGASVKNFKEALKEMGFNETETQGIFEEIKVAVRKSVGEVYTKYGMFGFDFILSEDKKLYGIEINSGNVGGFGSLFDINLSKDHRHFEATKVLRDFFASLPSHRFRPLTGRPFELLEGQGESWHPLRILDFGLTQKRADLISEVKPFFERATQTGFGDPWDYRAMSRIAQQEGDLEKAIEYSIEAGLRAKKSSYNHRSLYTDSPLFTEEPLSVEEERLLPPARSGTKTFNQVTRDLVWSMHRWPIKAVAQWMDEVKANHFLSALDRIVEGFREQRGEREDMVERYRAMLLLTNNFPDLISLQRLIEDTIIDKPWNLSMLLFSLPSDYALKLLEDSVTVGLSDEEKQKRIIWGLRVTRQDIPASYHKDLDKIFHGYLDKIGYQGNRKDLEDSLGMLDEVALYFQSPIKWLKLARDKETLKRLNQVVETHPHMPQSLRDGWFNLIKDFESGEMMNRIIEVISKVYPDPDVSIVVRATKPPKVRTQRPTVSREERSKFVKGINQLKKDLRHMRERMLAGETGDTELASQYRSALHEKYEHFILWTPETLYATNPSISESFSAEDFYQGKADYLPILIMAVTRAIDLTRTAKMSRFISDGLLKELQETLDVYNRTTKIKSQAKLTVPWLISLTLTGNGKQKFNSNDYVELVALLKKLPLSIRYETFAIHMLALGNHIELAGPDHSGSFVDGYTAKRMMLDALSLFREAVNEKEWRIIKASIVRLLVSMRGWLSLYETYRSNPDQTSQEFLFAEQLKEIFTALERFGKKDILAWLNDAYQRDRRASAPLVRWSPSTHLLMSQDENRSPMETFKLRPWSQATQDVYSRDKKNYLVRLQDYQNDDELHALVQQMYFQTATSLRTHLRSKSDAAMVVKVEQVLKAELTPIEQRLPEYKPDVAIVQPWVRDHLDLWVQMLKIAEENEVRAHGTAGMAFIAGEKNVSHHRWSLLGIMVSGEVKRNVYGNMAPLKFSHDDEEDFERPDNFGPFFVVFKSQVGYRDELNRDTHAIYLIPDSNERRFFTVGMRKAVEKRLISQREADGAIAKLMTLQEFVDLKDRVQEIINGQVTPEKAISDRAMLVNTTFSDKIKMRGGFEFAPVPGSGLGTRIGTGRDIALRKDSDGAIVEMGTYRHHGPFETFDEPLAPTDNSKVILLARTFAFADKPLMDETKKSIFYYHGRGARFIVGDDSHTDEHFIDYLIEIGANFTMYYAGRTPGINLAEKISKPDITKTFNKDNPSVSYDRKQLERRRQQLMDVLARAEEDADVEHIRENIQRIDKELARPEPAQILNYDKDGETLEIEDQGTKKILKSIGGSGINRVFDLGRTVIRVLKNGSAVSDVQMAFIQGLADQKDSHIPQYIRHATSGNGFSFIEMEKIEGMSMDETLNRPLTSQELDQVKALLKWLVDRKLVVADGLFKNKQMMLGHGFRTTVQKAFLVDVDLLMQNNWSRSRLIENYHADLTQKERRTLNWNVLDPNKEIEKYLEVLRLSSGDAAMLGDGLPIDYGKYFSETGEVLRKLAILRRTNTENTPLYAMDKDGYLQFSMAKDLSDGSYWIHLHTRDDLKGVLFKIESLEGGRIKLSNGMFEDVRPVGTEVAPLGLIPLERFKEARLIDEIFINEMTRSVEEYLMKIPNVFNIIPALIKNDTVENVLGRVKDQDGNDAMFWVINKYYLNRTDANGDYEEDMPGWGMKVKVHLTDAAMTTSARPIMGMNIMQSQTSQQRQLVDTLMQLRQEGHGPIIVNPALGLEGLKKADAILKERNAVAIVIGSTAPELWDENITNVKLKKHHDIDILVLTDGFELKEDFEEGIDWWLPKDVMVGGKSVKLYVNGHNFFLRAGLKFPNPILKGGRPLESGLYLPSQEFLVNLTESVTVAAVDHSVTPIDQQARLVFRQLLRDELGENVSNLWRKNFHDVARVFGFHNDLDAHAIRVVDFDHTMVKEIGAETPYRDMAMTVEDEEDILKDGRDQAMLTQEPTRDTVERMSAELIRFVGRDLMSPSGANSKLKTLRDDYRESGMEAFYSRPDFWVAMGALDTRSADSLYNSSKGVVNLDDNLWTLFYTTYQMAAHLNPLTSVRAHRYEILQVDANTERVSVVDLDAMLELLPAFVQKYILADRKKELDTVVPELNPSSQYQAVKYRDLFQLVIAQAIGVDMRTWSNYTISRNNGFFRQNGKRHIETTPDYFELMKQKLADLKDPDTGRSLSEEALKLFDEIKTKNWAALGLRDPGMNLMPYATIHMSDMTGQHEFKETVFNQNRRFQDPSFRIFDIKSTTRSPQPILLTENLEAFIVHVKESLEGPLEETPDFPGKADRLNFTDVVYNEDQNMMTYAPTQEYIQAQYVGDDSSNRVFKYKNSVLRIQKTSGKNLREEQMSFLRKLAKEKDSPIARYVHRGTTRNGYFVLQVEGIEGQVLTRAQKGDASDEDIQKAITLLKWLIDHNVFIFDLFRDGNTMLGHREGEAEKLFVTNLDQLRFEPDRTKLIAAYKDVYGPSLVWKNQKSLWPDPGPDNPILKFLDSLQSEHGDEAMLGNIIQSVIGDVQEIEKALGSIWYVLRAAKEVEALYKWENMESIPTKLSSESRKVLKTLEAKIKTSSEKERATISALERLLAVGKFMALNNEGKKLILGLVRAAQEDDPQLSAENVIYYIRGLDNLYDELLPLEAKEVLDRKYIQDAWRDDIYRFAKKLAQGDPLRAQDIIKRAAGDSGSLAETSQASNDAAMLQKLDKKVAIFFRNGDVSEADKSEIETFLRTTDVVALTLERCCSDSNVDFKAISSLYVSVHSMEGTNRSVYKISVFQNGNGSPAAKFAMKVSRGKDEDALQQTVLTKIVNEKLGKADTFIGRLSDGRFVMTGTLYEGFTLYQLREDPRRNLLIKAAVKESVSIWKTLGKIFILDPHERQFIVQNFDNPDILRVLLVDKGNFRIKDASPIQLTVDETGELIAEMKGKDLRKLEDWLAYVGESEIMERLINEFSSPPEMPSYEQMDPDMEMVDRVRVSRDIPLEYSTLVEGVIEGLGRTSAVDFFKRLREQQPERRIKNFSELNRQISLLLPEVDKAMLNKAPGGIDLNSQQMKLTTEGQHMDIEFPAFDAKQIPLENIQGFRPVIINIQPLRSFPLLGANVIEDKQEVSLVR